MSRSTASCRGKKPRTILVRGIDVAKTNTAAAATHVQEIAEFVVLGGDEADPARGVLVLSAVLNVHLEERRESLEKVSEARFIGERRHSPLRTSERNHDAATTTGGGVAGGGILSVPLSYSLQ